MIEAVIFDMDGVLCELNDPKRLNYLSALCGLSPTEIREAIWNSGFEDLSDSGAVDAMQYLSGFGERLGYPLTLQDWARYRRAGTIPFPRMLKLASQVANKARIAVLTNNGLLLRETIAVVFPELTAVFGEQVYVSAQFRKSKPDPEIFLDVCKELNSTPSRTLMIDDRSENTDGARLAGLRGHLFTSIDELRRDSYLEGLIDMEEGMEQ